MKFLLSMLTALTLAFASPLLNTKCRDQNINRIIKQMGPYAYAAMCSEWERTRQGYNVRRDVPYTPVPKSEYRIRLDSVKRR